MTLVSSTLGMRRVLRSLPNSPPERRQIQHVALIGANHEANVGHHQEQPDVQEGPRTLRNRGARQDETHQIRAENSENRADGGADQAAHAGALQPNLKQKDGNRKGQTDPRSSKVG